MPALATPLQHSAGIPGQRNRAKKEREKSLQRNEINTQKSSALLYANNVQFEHEIRKTIQFTIASKNE